MSEARSPDPGEQEASRAPRGSESSPMEEAPPLTAAPPTEGSPPPAAAEAEAASAAPPRAPPRIVSSLWGEQLASIWLESGEAKALDAVFADMVGEAALTARGCETLSRALDPAVLCALPETAVDGFARRLLRCFGRAAPTHVAREAAYEAARSAREIRRPTAARSLPCALMDEARPFRAARVSRDGVRHNVHDDARAPRVDRPHRAVHGLGAPSAAGLAVYRRASRVERDARSRRLFLPFEAARASGWSARRAGRSEASSPSRCGCASRVFRGTRNRERASSPRQWARGERRNRRARQSEHCARGRGQERRASRRPRGRRASRSSALLSSTATGAPSHRSARAHIALSVKREWPMGTMLEARVTALVAGSPRRASARKCPSTCEAGASLRWLRARPPR